MTWDATDVVRQAIAADQSTVTLALRIAEDFQGDVAHGRRYDHSPGITIAYNFPPNVPTDLEVDNKSCSDGPFYSGSSEPSVSAAVSDPDGTYGLAGRLAFWPVDHPEQRVERYIPYAYSTIGGPFPPGMVVDGGTYAWTARAEDGDDVSAWSEPCQFTSDLSVPRVAPVVTSSDYPNDGTWHGGAGIPGTFTFSANGVSDVAGFYWADHDQPSSFAAADQLGGTATITYTPTRSGPRDVYVRSVDRAGNRSPITIHHFYVAATEPIVHGVVGTHPVGLPFELRVEPRMANTVAYTYRVNGGAETTTPAAADGTAVVSVITPNVGLNRLEIWGTTSAGLRSGVAQEWLHATDAPIVSSEVYPEDGIGGGPGVPGEFTITPQMPGVVEYVYMLWWDFETAVHVPARPDGTATFTFTPAEPGYQVISVTAYTATGQSQLSTDYWFGVGP